jgi:hypothetical protein
MLKAVKRFDTFLFELEANYLPFSSNKGENYDRGNKI